MSEANRRLAAVLAADVVGYSAMVGKDEPATLARVRTLRGEVVEPVAATHGGRLFKTTGDGFLIAFASAVQALRCAIAIQEQLRSKPDGLQLRIGVHQGEVARHSAFTYKGRAVDIRQVGRELGVRYVLEGSVRKAGSRVRITGQLVEAATGAHLWADRFDGTLEDVFELQDQVTASVVGAIEPNLRSAEIQRAQRKPAENLQAYDLMLRALPQIYALTRDGLAEAARLLRRTIEIDPNYAPGLAYLAWCQWTSVAQNWIVDRSDPTVAGMLQLARTALALDGDDPDILRTVAIITALPGGDLSSGIALIDKSISLNPNNAAANQTAAMLHAFTGDKQSVVAHLDRSVRLNPLGRTASFYYPYALVHFVTGEHEAVLEWTGKILQERPNYAPGLRYRAASLGLLGRLEEGRQIVQRILEQVPDFTISRARRHIEFDLNNIFKTPRVADALYEGLRRCGVPE